MRARHGFTLIELTIVLVVMSILALVSVGVERSARRNASLSRATFDAVLRLKTLRAVALRDQQDVVVVFRDSKDANACSWSTPSDCASYTILKPDSTWKLDGYNLDPPIGAGGTYVASYLLPVSVKFHLAVTSAPPAPFQALAFFDPTMLGTCNARPCIAIRYTASGEVRGELKGGGSAPLPGVALALTTNLVTTNQLGAAGSGRKGILVSFPGGIVRSFGTF